MKRARTRLEFNDVADEVSPDALEPAAVEMLAECGVVGIGPGACLEPLRRLEVWPRDRPLQDYLLCELVEADEALSKGSIEEPLR